MGHGYVTGLVTRTRSLRVLVSQDSMRGGSGEQEVMLEERFLSVVV